MVHGARERRIVSTLRMYDRLNHHRRHLSPRLQARRRASPAGFARYKPSNKDGCLLGDVVCWSCGAVARRHYGTGVPVLV